MGPHQPVQCSIDLGEVSFTRMEVRSPKDRCSCSGSHGSNIQSISCEGRSENLAIVHQLSWQAGVLGDLLTHSSGAGCRAVPVEIEGDKNFHAIAFGGLVRVAELRVGVAVDSNVQSEGVDSKGFGSLHVIVEVGCACAVTDDANLARVSWQESL